MKVIRSYRGVFELVVLVLLSAVTTIPLSLSSNIAVAESGVDTFGEVVCRHREALDVYEMIHKYLPKAVLRGGVVSIGDTVLLDAGRVSIICLGEAPADGYVVDSFAARGEGNTYSFSIWRMSMDEAIAFNNHFLFNSTSEWMQTSEFFMIDSNTTAVSTRAARN
ncbi:hypothetical protein [Devosia sp. Root413D1]|jgi:hypothetical protein|uniref:hypothetical protein n=1 Tax=Devosia sp. Root413D1 TaxID=1736531 RepID=UPI0012E3C3E7|nr:hypothetical protein [Devosia sp. Root413D1]